MKSGNYIKNDEYNLEKFPQGVGMMFWQMMVDYYRTNWRHDSTGDQYCGGRLDRPSGTFKTPNWPEKDYPAGVTCSWHIVAPKNQVRMYKIKMSHSLRYM